MKCCLQCLHPEARKGGRHRCTIQECFQYIYVFLLPNSTRSDILYRVDKVRVFLLGIHTQRRGKGLDCRLSDIKSHIINLVLQTPKLRTPIRQKQLEIGQSYRLSSLQGLNNDI